MAEISEITSRRQFEQTARKMAVAGCLFSLLGSFLFFETNLFIDFLAALYKSEAILKSGMLYWMAKMLGIMGLIFGIYDFMLSLAYSRKSKTP